MNYFNEFPLTRYSFGNKETPVIYQNLSVYVDLLDQIKDDISFYQFYHILEGERSDVLSYEFYGTSSYHWTFYLMNDHLKEFGWPLTNASLNEKIQTDLHHTVLTTQADFVSLGLQIGTEITGLSSLATAKIRNVIPDLGQLVLDNDVVGEFRNSEIIYFFIDGERIDIQIKDVVAEYNSAHHFEDEEGNWVDITPSVTLEPALYTEVTHGEMYARQNEKQKIIRIIRPDTIDSVVHQFKKSIRG